MCWLQMPSRGQKSNCQEERVRKRDRFSVNLFILYILYFNYILASLAQRYYCMCFVVVNEVILNTFSEKVIYMYFNRCYLYSQWHFLPDKKEKTVLNDTRRCLIYIYKIGLYLDFLYRNVMFNILCGLSTWQYWRWMYCDFWKAQSNWITND